MLSINDEYLLQRIIEEVMMGATILLLGEVRELIFSVRSELFEIDYAALLEEVHI
jgi:hypothetical protein